MVSLGRSQRPGMAMLKTSKEREGCVPSYRRKNVREHPNRKRETGAIIKGQAERNRRQRQNVYKITYQKTRSYDEVI